MKQLQEVTIAIVTSSYRPEITKSLEKYCIATLQEKGLTEKQIDIFSVPGALELPLVSKKLAQRKIYDAIIVFGAVLKGKTYHFEQVADECVRGCMKVSYDYDIPVVFEVLCVYDPKDALERATGKDDDRGVEGALTALQMIALVETL
jgi:6,7-dimethyl-8-ribityllumazine synthase